MQNSLQDGAAWPLTAIHSLSDAILHTVIYADLFDYPLTSQEIHRYLPRYDAPLSVIEEYIASDDHLCKHLESIPPYWFLAGRDQLVDIRLEREALSKNLWRLAWRYAHLIAAIPFVRLVAVTGSLAMNNVASADDDIDFLIVTQTGRVWLTRGLVILVVHLAQRAGIELCPNYVMAERSMELGEPSFFTAHELAQIVPLYGLETYRHFLQRNDWMIRFLPNATPRQASTEGIGRMAVRVQRFLEGVLCGRMGDALERWERDRKIPRLSQTAARRGSTSAVFTPDLCKGHVNDHATGVRQRYAAQLAAQEM